MSLVDHHKLLFERVSKAPKVKGYGDRKVVMTWAEAVYAAFPTFQPRTLMSMWLHKQGYDGFLKDAILNLITIFWLPDGGDEFKNQRTEDAAATLLWSMPLIFRGVLVADLSGDLFPGPSFPELYSERQFREAMTSEDT